MPSPPVLSSILAYVRAGALSQAQRLFREAGLEAVTDQPAVLAVRGRLLKEAALAVTGDARARLQAQAAQAYGAAGALSGETYHLINAAALWRLAGQGAAAEADAARVLEVLERRPDEAETPYWRAATKAEALLILGRTDAAAEALRTAVALAPQAWEDHAATLRQLRLICAAQAQPAAWLEALQPPRAIHFAGHMSLGTNDADLERRVADALAQETVGFGFGALAAGADIVIAEALAARGAELHLILPAGPAAFRAASVARQGEDWGLRYDRLLGQAASVETVGPEDRPLDALSLQLAAEIAMGQAAMLARALQTEAVQLLVLDLDARSGAAPGSSGWARRAWADAGRRQVILQAPRRGRAAAPIPPPAPGARLLARLAVGLPPARVGELAAPLTQAPAPAAPPFWAAGAVHLAYDRPSAAAAAVDALVAAFGADVRVAGDYAASVEVAVPGGALTAGDAVDLPLEILSVTPPGGAQVTTALAAAVFAGDPDRRLEPMGDLERPGGGDPLPLFALRPS